MSRRQQPMGNNQRSLTDTAGERVAEMLNWRAGDHLDFVIAVWPRRGDGRATVYLSAASDGDLVSKLADLIAAHRA